MTACWRCGRTDQDQKPADPALHPDGTVECVDPMDCVRVRFHDGKPGPSLGEGVRRMYQADYDAHRDCGPDCLLGRQALGHLIASSRPAEES
jgi:hypothetical protein